MKSPVPSDFRGPPTLRQKIWYCCDECEIACADKKLLYTKGVIFAGLNHEAFKCAIRSNDGKRMQMYHKMHMIPLFNKKHSLYLRIYHRILALMVNGHPHIRHDLLHNSTLNYRGYEGGNLSFDFVNELLNKVFKGGSGTIISRLDSFSIINLIKPSVQ
jgi:hypothetical protein